jgi:acyl-coenzyme A synthetase/AMP-(fatty) acid ligase
VIDLLSIIGITLTAAPSQILEVAVVGLAHEKWGEAPCAFVVQRAGAETTESELREFARANMAHFKVPQEFRFVPELPKTATGKIQKHVLQRGKPAISKQWGKLGLMASFRSNFGLYSAFI